METICETTLHGWWTKRTVGLLNTLAVKTANHILRRCMRGRKQRMQKLSLLLHLAMRRLLEKEACIISLVNKIHFSFKIQIVWPVVRDGQPRNRGSTRDRGKRVLGAFAKLRKATHVCPVRMQQLSCHWMDFHEI
jgi:hypothetical protein